MELAAGHALQISRGNMWKDVWTYQLCHGSYASDPNPSLMSMRRHVLFVAEAWIKREHFLIYLKPRAEMERAETVLVNNSDLEMEGSGIDLVVVPKELSTDKLDKMEQVLKMKESSPVLYSYDKDKYWSMARKTDGTIDGSVSGKSRLTATPKDR